MIAEKWCKSALTLSKLPGIVYSLNPYIGCQHKCKYCYVPSVFQIKREEWMKKVYAKVNIPNILRKELKKKKKGVVGISTVTDPYQKAEKKYELTKKCMLLLLKNRWPIDVLTKSDLVVRDANILKEFGDAKVGITLTTLDDATRSMFEPFASSINQRLNALKTLAHYGIYTYVFLGPLLPDIEKNEVKTYIQTFLEIGVQEIIIDYLHLKKGVWNELCTVLNNEKKQLYKSRMAHGYYQEILNEFSRQCKNKITLTKAF
jgi:DNA repair photolyase